MAHTTGRRYEGVHRRPPHSEIATVAVFVVVGMAVAAGLALMTGTVARRIGSEQGNRSFEQLAVVVAGSVVAPLLTPQLRAGDESAWDTLDRSVDGLRRSGPIEAVTVRDDHGDVIWTDDEGAITAPLRPHERTALRDGTITLDPASTDGSPQDPVVAAVGVQDTTGAPLLVDVVGRRTELTTATRSVWNSFAPLALGAVLLLELLQLPLIWRLARRVQLHQRTEAALREAAGVAIDVERRRIAREVHDDVLPGLHGLAYELDAARLSAAHHDGAAALLDRTAEGLRAGIRQLRALLLDLSQDRMPEAGLEAALAEMADRMETTGVHVSVQAPDIGALPRPAAEILYRCAQEALRNVAAHSGAEQVGMVIAVDTADVTMTIDDDGRGFEASRLIESRAAGHLGLRALGDLVADSGGSLTASSSPGQGTRLIVRVPLDEVGIDMRVQR